jgi:hypothetical protein
MSNHRPPSFLRLADWLALLISMASFLASALVTWRVFEAIPHLEDEVAYVWQARLLTEGKLTIPSPAYPTNFLVPFVVDHNGLRFGKYPPGWPAVLALGELLHLRAWVNPLLAGLGVWLTYCLARRIFNRGVGLLAAFLTVTSPFFLLNTGSLLSHPLGLVLSTGFTWAWLAAFGPRPSARPWLPTLVAAALLVALLLTRPLTAAAVALPFVLQGAVLLLRGSGQLRLRLLSVALVGAAGIGLYMLWQYSLTGDAFLNPYTLWWDYDRVGFGPGYGVTESGHSLAKALVNTRLNLYVGTYDLFGWGPLSWLFLPFGVWAARRNSSALLSGSVFLSLLVVYMSYWIGATLFGPRYYFEGLFSLTILSAAGVAWLAGWPTTPHLPYRSAAGWRKLRPLLVVWLFGVLVGFNLTLYAPFRLGSMQGLYNISASDQAPFRQPEVQALAPALVIVRSPRWMEYGALLDLENPELTSPFIFAWNNNPGRDAALAAEFPERMVYYYYPDRQPFQLYSEPQP